MDVREPPRAARQREDVQVVARRVDDAAQQLVEPEPRRERPLGGEALGEGAQALAVVGAEAPEEVVAARGYERRGLRGRRGTTRVASNHASAAQGGRTSRNGGTREPRAAAAPRGRRAAASARSASGAGRGCSPSPPRTSRAARRLRALDRAPRVAAAGARDVRERVGGQADERRREDAVERGLVARVGERGEPGAEVADDLAAPVAAAADRQRQQALVLERALVDGQVAEAAQQHDDLLGPRVAGVDEVADALGEQARLGVAPRLRARQLAEVGRVVGRPSRPGRSAAARRAAPAAGRRLAALAQRDEVGAQARARTPR